MAYPQHGLSRTLPKNFTFPSVSQDTPRTPEHSSTIRLDVPPPPPRHSSCRVRRSRVRSGTDVFAQAEYDRTTFLPNHSDLPLPSIEFPPSCDTASFPPCATIPPSNDHFLAPPRDRTAMKTPPAQIRADPAEPQTTGSWTTSDPRDLGEAIDRPGSACSHASDSSISSIETYASHRSVGGSCTSMESDSYDPFFHLELPPKPAVESPPLPRKQNRKSRGLPSKERWTMDMDNHLWNTYQLYIQDPLITPFKMTPGSIPPLGVTHRVAREAKKTWERRRFRLFNRQLSLAPQQPQSGESTPTPKADAGKPIWPRSEASTRRRLKLLCKRKFSIAPHYQRMMQSRSPTPFLDLFSRPAQDAPRVEGPDNNSTAYATRDLGVSLVSSSVPGPLSQLAAESPSSDDMNHEWFSQPVSQPSRPPIVNPLSTKSHSFDERQMGSRLGSPFTYNTWGPGISKKAHRHPPKGRRETIHVTGSRLRSPPRLDSFPHVESLDLPRNDPLATQESPGEQETRRDLEELFRQGKLNDLGHRRIRIRNRGATTSAVNNNNNNKGLDQLFSPPSSSSRNDDSYTMEKPVASPLQNLSAGENIKRLGSPFKVDSSKRQGPPSRYIRHAPSRSDPFANGLLRPRLSTPDAQTRGRGMTTTQLPYDPTEAGISDAERIRRQILNMPYSRQ